MALSCFQQTGPECRIESDVTTGGQKKIDCFSVDGICNLCNSVLEAMGCYFHYCPCRKTCPSLTDNEIMRGIKKGNKTKCTKNISNRKDTKFLKWECNWCELYRTVATIKNHPRTNFPYQRPLSEERLMQEIKSRRLFGYVQCDLKVLHYLKACFANVPPIFKNTVVSGIDIGDWMEEYAEKETIMS